MRRPGRLGGVLALLLVPLSLLAGPAGAARAGGASRAAQRAAPKSPAVERLASCIRENKRVLALFLIDESASLKETDPGQDRVRGLQVALHELDQVRSTVIDGDRPEVEVYLASFSVGFDTLTGWTPLRDGALPRLKAQAATYATRNRGLDTDYYNAFLGAKRVMDERTTALTRDGSAAPCKVMFWFTDGRYDVEDRTTPERRDQGVTKAYAPDIRLDRQGGGATLVARGRRLMCDPGGLADRLRSADVITLAVALTTGITREDQRFLQAVATGSGGGQRCGTRPDRPVGLLTRAGEVTAIVLEFDQYLQTFNGGTPGPSEELGVCRGAPCPEGTLTFTVDPGLRRFHVLALTGASGIVVELRSPGSAKRLQFTPTAPGTGKLGSAAIRHSWVAPEALVVDAELPPDTSDWAGEWKVTFIDPSGTNPDAVAHAQIHLFGDLVPKVVGNPQLTRGERSAFEVQLVRADGTPAPPEDLFQTLKVRATVTDPDGGSPEAVNLTPDAAGRYHGDYLAPPARRSSFINLTLRLDATTRSGVALVPVDETYAVPVLPPSSYPLVAPARPRFPSLEGEGSSETELTVTGGKVDGCVWVDTGTSHFEVFPSEVTTVAVGVAPAATSRETCMKVAAGQRLTMRLRATPDAVGSGPVKGDIQLRLLAIGNDRVEPLALPVSFQMLPPLNPTFFWLLFFGLLIPGILLPFVAVWVAKYLTGKFQPTNTLRYAILPVRVRGRELRRPGPDGDNQPLLPFEATEFQAVPAGTSEKRRRWELHGIRFVARAGARPFTPPVGTASDDGIRIIGAGRSSASWRAAEVPLGLEKTWLFLVDEVTLDDADPASGAAGGGEGPDRDAAPQRKVATATGRLLAFIRTGSATRQLRELEPSVTRILPGRIRELAEADAAAAAEQRPAEPVATAPGPPRRRGPTDEPVEPPRPPERPAPADAPPPLRDRRSPPPPPPAPPGTSRDRPAGGPEMPPGRSRSSSGLREDAGGDELPPPDHRRRR